MYLVLVDNTRYKSFVGVAAPVLHCTTECIRLVEEEVRRGYLDKVALLPKVKFPLRASNLYEHLSNLYKDRVQAFYAVKTLCFSWLTELVTHQCMDTLLFIAVDQDRVMATWNKSTFSKILTNLGIAAKSEFIAVATALNDMLLHLDRELGSVNEYIQIVVDDDKLLNILAFLAMEKHSVYTMYGRRELKAKYRVFKTYKADILKSLPDFIAYTFIRYIVEKRSINEIVTLFNPRMCKVIVKIVPGRSSSLRKRRLVLG